jgi:hypothetical protein
MVFLKWILVLGLLVAGVLALLAGLGVGVPFVKYEGLEAHGVPAGGVILIAAIALAFFWKITVKIKTTVEKTSPGGGSIRSIREVTRKYWREPDEP